MYDYPHFENHSLDNHSLDNPSLETHTQSITKESNTKESITKESNTNSADSISSNKNSVDYKAIQDLYNSICISFPKCTVLSEKRKKAIRARINSGYKIEDFKTLFEKAESSDFLKGQNGRNWNATFDWLIKDDNMAKVLDGNYDKRTNKSNSAYNQQQQKKSIWRDELI